MTGRGDKVKPPKFKSPKVPLIRIKNPNIEEPKMVYSPEFRFRVKGFSTNTELKNSQTKPEDLAEEMKKKAESGARRCVEISVKGQK